MSLGVIHKPLRPVPDQANQVLTYQVKPGDTLIDLAQAYMNRPAIKGQRLNRIEEPRRLQTGQSL